MTDIDLGDTPLKPIVLSREKRVTLGGGAVAPADQSDRIALGIPKAQALTADAVDADACPFLTQNAGSSYWLLGLVCSFRALEGAPIERAWLEVTLTALGDGHGSEPTAWSMEPLSLSDPVQISRVAKLDSSLKLNSSLVPVDVGVGGTTETTTSVEGRVPYVEAYREGTSRPSWIFVRTPVTEVRGAHRLRMVVELPTGVSARATVNAGATLRLKLIGLIPYRTPLDDRPEERSVVFGATSMR